MAAMLACARQELRRDHEGEWNRYMATISPTTSTTILDGTGDRGDWLDEFEEWQLGDDGNVATTVGGVAGYACCGEAFQGDGEGG